MPVTEAVSTISGMSSPLPDINVRTDSPRINPSVSTAAAVPPSPNFKLPRRRDLGKRAGRMLRALPETEPRERCNPELRRWARRRSRGDGDAPSPPDLGESLLIERAEDERVKGTGVRPLVFPLALGPLDLMLDC